jgi:hypothetical protein
VPTDDYLGVYKSLGKCDSCKAKGKLYYMNIDINTETFVGGATGSTRDFVISRSGGGGSGGSAK